MTTSAAVPLSWGTPSNSEPKSVSPPWLIPTSRPSRSACVACRASKVQCKDVDDELVCARCRRRGTRCAWPVSPSPEAAPAKRHRVAKGAVLNQLRLTLAGPTSTTNQLNIEQLSASLQHSLVISARDKLGIAASAMSGVMLEVMEYDWWAPIPKKSLIDAQLASVVALGSVVSTHSAIIGSSRPSTARYLIDRSRQVAFHSLATKAFETASEAGVVDPVQPKQEGYKALLVLNFLLASTTQVHERYDEVRDRVFAQRMRLLNDPTVAEAKKEEMRTKEAVAMLIGDSVYAIKTEAPHPALSEAQLAAQFGLTRAGWAVELAYLDAAAAAAAGQESYLGADPDPELVFNKSGIVYIWVTRTLVNLKRKAREGSVVFSLVAGEVERVASSLRRLESAINRFLARIRAQQPPAERPNPPIGPHDLYDPAVQWQFYMPSIQARLTALQLHAWDVTSLLVKACLPECGPAVWPEHAALVAEVELTAARVLKGAIAAIGAAGPAGDVFNLASFLEGGVVPLGPGCETVELALRAAGEAGTGTALGAVGIGVGELEVLRAGLLQASAASASAREQLRALDKGLHESRKAGPGSAVRRVGDGASGGGDAVAQAMVERALMELVGEDQLE